MCLTPIIMNTIFDQFAEAHTLRNGYKLAQTLSPVPPPDDPHRLMAVWRSTNSHSVKGDIKHFIKSSTSHRRKLDHDETTGWVEVYTSYWKAIAEILAGESGKVRNPLVLYRILLIISKVYMDQSVRGMEGTDLNTYPRI